ncbi:adenosine kinase [Criblamydia sequanensis]|uniref:PfkB family carbohydrate kinase n=1 Tax=Candidatus Criblamydia sequanensis CRIB-18 TaxID=1437425 RepID=A0A090DYS6_9BACT|nr:adenosine kinase [Criblamydia sequanensis]CDR33854.1 PfkB family carbohydrate kinase [Criblamydia sequanensis CRIB-18]
MKPVVVGIGACIMDYLLHVNEKDLLRFSGGSKGGMELVSFEEFSSLIIDLGPPKAISSGGSAANMLKGLAKLGLDSLFFGCIGRDPIGSFFQRDMGKHKVETHLSESAAPTSTSACLVTEDGERTMRTFIGASQYLSTKDISFSSLERASWIHLEGYLMANPSLFEKIFSFAKANKIPISLDLSSFEIVNAFRSNIEENLQDLSLLVANAKEAQSLTGLDPENACKKLHKSVGKVILLNGKNGCYVAENGKIHKEDAVKTNVVDSTGAGDFFLSGYLYALFKGASLENRAKAGNFLASQVLNYYGADIEEAKWPDTITRINTLIS